MVKKQGVFKSSPHIPVSPGDLATVAEQSDPSIQKNKTLLQRHPAQLPAFLCKMYLFCFISAFGNVLEGEDDMEDLEADRLL